MVICYRLLSDAQQRRETYREVWILDGLELQSRAGWGFSLHGLSQMSLCCSLEEVVVNPVGAWQAGLVKVSKA